MEVRRKHIIIIISIIFVSFILVGVGGYFIYHNVIVKDLSEEKEEKKKDTEKEAIVRGLSSAEQSILLEQIKEYNSYLSSSYPVSNLNEMDNQMKLRFALKKVKVENQSFMESDLQKILEQYFGSFNTTKHEDIICPNGDGVLYQYNSSTRKYQFYGTHGHGGDGVYGSETYFLNGKVKDNLYTVDVAILYSNYCGDICGPVDSYYKTAQDSYERKNAIYTVEDESILVSEVYTKVQNQLAITSFAFKKDDNGNYGLQKVSVS